MEVDSDPEECFVDELDPPCTEISIAVVEGIPRGHGISAYVGYVVKMKYIIQLTIERRYSEFAALREVLVKRWPGVMVPPLPAKHSSGSNSLRVVNERVKYLTYFLNNCVKLNFIFMSDQFQLFLTSPDPDLRRAFEKMLPLPYLLMLNRYEKAFPEVKPDESRKGELTVLLKEQVEPFLKQLQSQRIGLINLKRQVFKLAHRRDEYLRTAKILYCDTLPNLEAHLVDTTEKVNLVLMENQKIKDTVVEFKEFNSRNYWILYETLKLEIAEAQAMVDALQSRADLARQEERVAHDILVNEQELMSIQAKKITFRQLFSRSNEQLSRQLQETNQKLKEELSSLKVLSLLVSEVTTSQLLESYSLRRGQLWRTSFRSWLLKEQQSNAFLQQFHKLFLVC